MTIQVEDPAFDRAAKEMAEAFLSGVAYGPRNVWRRSVEMAGDAIGVHVHPTRDDIRFLVLNRSTWYPDMVR